MRSSMKFSNFKRYFFVMSILLRHIAPKYDKITAHRKPQLSIRRLPYCIGTTVYKAPVTGSQKMKESQSAFPCTIFSLKRSTAFS